MLFKQLAAFMIIAVAVMFFIAYLYEGGWNEITTFLSSMQEKCRNKSH